MPATNKVGIRVRIKVRMHYACLYSVWGTKLGLECMHASGSELWLVQVGIRVRIRISVKLDNETNLVLELIVGYQQSRHRGQN